MMIAPAEGEWVPDVCTLPTVEQPIRIAEFDRFFVDSVRRVHRAAPALLDLMLAAGVEAVARELAAPESSCCSFFRFEFTAGGADLVMRIGVPDSYVEVLDAFATRVEAAIGDAR